MAKISESAATVKPFESSMVLSRVTVSLLPDSFLTCVRTLTSAEGVETTGVVI